MCRHRFADIRYERAAKNGGPEHTEHSLMYLVDASALARPDEVAAAAVMAAREAPAREAAAKRAVAEAEAASKEAAQVQHAAAVWLSVNVVHIPSQAVYPCRETAASEGSAVRG